MDMKSSLAVFLVGCLVALALQVYFFSPLSSPQVLHLPDESLSHSFPPLNNRLQEVTKIGEGILKKPEDVSVDKEGRLFTATRDGWIRRLLKNGTLENWKWVNSTTLLGLTTTTSGDLVVCDPVEGLLRVNEDGVTNILSHVNGSKLRFADDVIEGKDGSLYFSIASTKFGLDEWYFDVLEARPHGKLLKYDPRTKETTVLLDSLFFANGVALSPDQDYLLVCESFKFRCLKYWLQGDLKGKVEIFVENLPGAPDNINLAPDGSFWIALLQVPRILVSRQTISDLIV
uniref:Strictosidine synthase n=1 Tax=Opuntia streptacantha TaxID=393608 RepID=A0A7C9FH52_OPUST